MGVILQVFSPFASVQVSSAQILQGSFVGNVQFLHARLRLPRRCARKERIRRPDRRFSLSAADDETRLSSGHSRRTCDGVRDLPSENTMSASRYPHISRPGVVGLVFLVSMWLLFAFWQWTEYEHQRRLIHASLSSQAESLASAVRGNIQSHRWFGPFVQQQLPRTLEILARSQNVVTIAIVVDDDLGDVYFAGDQEEADFSLPVGEHPRDGTLQIVQRFSLENSPPLMHAMHGNFPMTSESQEFTSVIVLNRAATLAQIRREGRNRMLIFGLGTLLLLATAAVWQFTFRLTQAEGKARILQSEARHLSELGQAAAGLAHETRNPLGLIRGWTERLVEAGLPDMVRQEQAVAVLEECDRVTARINQFLAFARPVEPIQEPLFLGEVVNDLRTLLQSDLDEHGLRLETSGINHPVAILADRDQLRQVLFNLLQNAIAFSPIGSTVKMTMHRSGQHRSKTDHYRLEIADQGPGVAAHLADTLFEPYVSQRSGGTGLGLSVVRRIAAAHDWQVGCQNGADGGAIFWVDGIHAADSSDIKPPRQG